jgi:hypothetical protein
MKDFATLENGQMFIWNNCLWKRLSCKDTPDRGLDGEALELAYIDGDGNVNFHRKPTEHRFNPYCPVQPVVVITKNI